MASTLTSTAPNSPTIKSDFVTIRIGEEPYAVDFQVNCEQRTSLFPYFRAAFNGEFRDAHERRTALADVTEQTFRIFLQWLDAQSDTSGETSVLDISVLSADPAAAAKAAMSPPPNSQPDPSTDEEKDIRFYFHKGHRYWANPTVDSNKFGTHAFDERHYHNRGTFPEYANMPVFLDDHTWNMNYQFFLISALKLFIFADGYNVPQLRNDILTALLGLVRAWRCNPTPGKALLDTAYDALPPAPSYVVYEYDLGPSSTAFNAFLVKSTATSWFMKRERGRAAAKHFREMNKEFAADVHEAMDFDEEGWDGTDQMGMRVGVSWV